MWAPTQRVLSGNGMFRADFRAFADNLGVYRTIGASVVTYRKVTHSFLFVSYTSWDGDATTSVTLDVTWTSAPNPITLTKTTRAGSTRSRPTTNLTTLALSGFGLSVSMDADIQGAPDPGTASVSPNAPDLPAQSVSAITIVTFPGGDSHKLTGADSF